MNFNELFDRPTANLNECECEFDDIIRHPRQSQDFVNEYKDEKEKILLSNDNVMLGALKLYLLDKKT